MTTCPKCNEIILSMSTHYCPSPKTASRPSDAAACSAGAVTYRELHEEAAGMGLNGSFFAVSKIDPNAPVKCNCAWNEGHGEHCDIVAANRILIQRKNALRQARAAQGVDDTRD